MSIRQEHSANKAETTADHIDAAATRPQIRHTFAEHGPADSQIAKVAGWLRHLIDPEQVVELRAIGVDDVPLIQFASGATKKPTYTGTFRGTELEVLARVGLEFSGRANVYVTSNPLKPERFVRQAPRLQRNSRAAEDQHVLERRWLFLDIDRPKAARKHAATAGERERLLGFTHRVRDYLTAEGFPAPVVMTSGNGYYLRYRHEPLPFALPLGEDDVIRRVLEHLAQKFNGEEGEVDTAVWNPGRICRLAGTLNIKHSPAADGTHPRCAVLETPAVSAVAPAGLLDELARRAMAVEPKTVVSVSGRTRAARSAGPLVGSAVVDAQLDRRIRGYMHEVPVCVSNQGGDTQLFDAACILVRGFARTPEAAYPYLAEYNSRCIPPWSDDRLWYKLHEAERDSTREAGYILNRERETVTAVPADVDLSDLDFTSLPGPYCSDCDNFTCEKVGPLGRCRCPADLIPSRPCAASKPHENKAGTLSSIERTVIEESVPTGLLDKLIGQPGEDYCPYAKLAGLEGCSAKSSYGAVALLRCKCWSKCDACRAFDRYAVKRDNLPTVAHLVTHLFSGTTEEWEGLRTRLAKLKVSYASFAISDGVTRTTVIALDPTSPAIPDTLAEIRRVSPLEAVTAAAAAIDAIPDHLPKGVRKFSPSHNWKLLVEQNAWDKVREVVAEDKAEAAEVKAMAPDERKEHRAAKQHARQEQILAEGGIVWRRLDDVPLRNVDEVADILDRHGVRDYRRRVLKGDNLLDSVVWEIPVEPQKTEAIRREIYELSISLPEPARDDPEWTWRCLL